MLCWLDYAYMNNMAGVLYEAGTAYRSRASVFTPSFLVVYTLLIGLDFCVVLLSCFVLWPLCPVFFVSLGLVVGLLLFFLSYDVSSRLLFHVRYDFLIKLCSINLSPSCLLKGPFLVLWVCLFAHSVVHHLSRYISLRS
jgi:uncharacterized membrane protein